MDKLEGIIFDLDGTLVDSAPHYLKALKASLAQNRVDVEPPSMDRLLHSMDLVTDLISLGVDCDVAKHISRQRDEAVIVLFSTQIDWMPGAEQFAKRAASIMPTGLVTSAWSASVDAIHIRTNVKHLFKVVIDGNMVKGRYKPDPYGLQLAAEYLQLPPGIMLYIGDREVDAAAAEAAGMKSCLIQKEVDKRSLGKQIADISVHSWDELEKLLF